MSREYSLRYRQQHEIVRSDLDPIHDVYGFFGLLAELTLAEKAASMLNVLIVEDDLSIADLLQTALKLEGYGVSGIARTVREAIESIAEQSPDFAVIDLRLAEGGCGTDVGVHLRRIVVNPGILYSTGNSNEIILTKPMGMPLWSNRI